MVIASSYPFLGILWSMLIFFAFVIWIWIAITVLIDLFRRHDVGGWAKALWVIFIIIAPFLGVLIYLIAYHQGMTERRTQEVQQAQVQFDEYVRQTAGSGGAASEIEKAKGLLDSGTITQAEFDHIKVQALGGRSGSGAAVQTPTAEPQ
jgi:Phospholipase_D-nuclease N-terminal